jgi:hypothetical protein
MQTTQAIHKRLEQNRNELEEIKDQLSKKE